MGDVRRCDPASSKISWGEPERAPHKRFFVYCGTLMLIPALFYHNIMHSTAKLKSSSMNTGQGAHGSISNEVHGVVTYMSPVEAFATAIRFFDLQKVGLFIPSHVEAFSTGIKIESSDQNPLGGGVIMGSR